MPSELGPGRSADPFAPTQRPPDDLPDWARTLTRLLDDAIPIPGTNIRFGWDALIGLLVPGGGDAASGALGVALLVLAFKLKVKTSVLLRMLGNLLLDTALGSVPLVGDVFDVAFKANRMNLELIRRYRGSRSAPPSLGDRLLFASLILLAVVALVLPLLLAGWLLSSLIGT